MILGIDLTTKPSGGGLRHINELLNNFNPDIHGFNKIIIISSEETLTKLKDCSWLIKRSPKWLNRNVFLKLYWLLFLKEKEFNEVDVIFAPFGTYLPKVKRVVSMSQNMLLFDKKERNRFFISKTWFKLNLLHYVQKFCFNKSIGLIFISQFAKYKITPFLKKSKIYSTVINHGISSDFIMPPKEQYHINTYSKDYRFKILFVSSIWVYKHPVNLIKAFKLLLKKGYPIELHIVGDNAQTSIGKIIDLEIKEFNDTIFWHNKVSIDSVNKFYLDANIFVFTSTCENMPNILIEAMSSGLPICCSNFDPMKEFLKDAGLYFNPLNFKDIANKIEELINNSNLRSQLSNKSHNFSKNYSWNKCTDETFNFLYTIANK
jgi:glycosyltransferase involved in cell wall biosynthesis